MVPQKDSWSWPLFERNMALLIVGEVAGRMERIAFGSVDAWTSEIINRDGDRESTSSYSQHLYSNLLTLDLVKKWQTIRLGQLESEWASRNVLHFKGFLKY